MYDPVEPLFVPVQAAGIALVASIRTARLPAGDRTGMAFTSLGRLTAAMGDGQAWVVMCEAALRATLAPIGIHRIQVDAEYVGPAVSRLPRSPVQGSAGTVAGRALTLAARADAVA